jgi:4-amino-4-deoxy-L-arabinose transferase-like glycosyltransferase
MTDAKARKRRDIWADLAEPSSVIAFLALYCAIHFLVRYLLSPNFTLDESEQMLFGQSLQWGYRFRHPPLITWLSWGTLSATNNSRAAFFLLKYVIMAGGLAVYFAAARVVIRDTRMAALATFGLLTTFVMGFLPLVDLMHTVLLATMLAAFLWIGARIVTKGSPRDYLLLAAITGFGILSKYVFLVLPVAFAIGVALTPRFRARIKIGPLILALILTLAIVAPYVWWSYAHEYSLFTLAKTITK